MSDIIYRKANVSDTDAIVRLVQLRINWMERMGLHQWNETDYFGRYPYDYWLGNIDSFCVGERDGKVVVAIALYNSDVRWEADGVLRAGVLPPSEVKAWYLHHLVSDPEAKGAGIGMMRYVERLAADSSIEALRLDSAVGNDGLERFYSALGYRECGRCHDQLYHGILREKRLLWAVD